VFEKNRAGDKILSVTAMDGHGKVVEFLLEEGDKVDTVNAKGRTPLMEAALSDRSAVVQRLVSAGLLSRIEIARIVMPLILCRSAIGMRKKGLPGVSCTRMT